MAEQDIRFPLAEERTFLAYERTAIGAVLACIVAATLSVPA